MDNNIDSQNQQNQNEEREIELTGGWIALYIILLVLTIFVLACIGTIIDLHILHKQRIAGAMGVILGIACKGVIKLFVYNLSHKKNKNEK